jgi:cardiolipin synthase
MLHAKTAVVDGMWARVGSTNLNLQSWMGNYELDVAVEDADFARQMEAIYIEDLANATEIVLSNRSRIRPIAYSKARRRRALRERGSGRAATSAVRWANSVGAALTSRRELGPAESHLMLGAGILLAVVAVVGVLWPRVITIPLAILAAWVALTSLVRAWRLAREQDGAADLPSIAGATEPLAKRLP